MLSAEDTVEAMHRRGRRVLATLSRLRPGERVDHILGRLCFWMLVLSMPMVFAGSLYPAVRGIAPYNLLVFVSGMFTAGCGYVFVRSRSVKGEEARINKNPELAGPFSTELTETGLTHITPKWTTVIDWSGIRTVLETRSLILITDSTPRTIIVPKRAFTSAHDAERFRSSIVARLKGEL